MNHLTIFPADITTLSVDQLAQLPPEQKCAIDTDLNEALAWLKQARAKFDDALEQCYGERARATLSRSGRDFGTAHFNDGNLRITFSLPKKTSWDQQQLSKISQRITASGEPVENYLDIKLSVSESRYNHWPTILQQQFASARTVQAGKPSFTFSLHSVEEKQ